MDKGVNIPPLLFFFDGVTLLERESAFMVWALGAKRGVLGKSGTHHSRRFEKVKAFGPNRFSWMNNREKPLELRKE